MQVSRAQGMDKEKKKNTRHREEKGRVATVGVGDGEAEEKITTEVSARRGIFLKRSGVKAVRALGSNRGGTEIGLNVMK